jgi:heme-degrading monooxygenase HmoA
VARTCKFIASGRVPEAFPRDGRSRAAPVPGFAGAQLARRHAGDKIEFLVLTRWQSMDAIRAFAGTNVEKAVVEPGAVAALMEFDSRVRHYDVVEEA